MRGVSRGSSTVPLWRLRAGARLPRAAVTAAGVVLALVGLKALVSPADTAGPKVAPAPQRDVAAEAFAESFVRTYLTRDVDDRERRGRALQRFGLSADASAGDATEHSEAVRWSAVVGSSRSSDGRVVTVAAQTSRRQLHLAVTVRRDDRGLLAVTAAPAIVGPPPVAQGARPRPEDEVGDQALRAVAGRVVKNYLALERENLAADLAPGAVVSMPEQRLKVASIDGVTWSGRRVAVALSAEGADGVRLSLRYELAVVRDAGRWLVRTVHVNPTATGGR